MYMSMNHTQTHVLLLLAGAHVSIDILLMISIIVPSTARITHLCLYSFFFSAQSYLSNTDCPCPLLEREPTFSCPSLLILYDSVWGFAEIGMFVCKRSKQLLTHRRALAPREGDCQRETDKLKVC